MIRSALAACLALLQGCATPAREGAGLPFATVYAARMKTEPSFRERAIQMSEVDGKIVGNSFRGFPEMIEVDPGEHKIKYRYYDSDADGPGPVREVSLRAKAGARYIITFEPSEVRQTAIWIEDRGTGEIVGGAAPSRENMAVPPPVETEIPKADWRTISSETSVKLYAKSGRVLNGRVISCDGEYIWLKLPEGGRKALLTAEVDKIAALK